jgi:hypothetical protein
MTAFQLFFADGYSEAAKATALSNINDIVARERDEYAFAQTFAQERMIFEFLQLPDGPYAGLKVFGDAFGQ